MKYFNLVLITFLLLTPGVAFLADKELEKIENFVYSSKHEDIIINDEFGFSFSIPEGWSLYDINDVSTEYKENVFGGNNNFYLLFPEINNEGQSISVYVLNSSVGSVSEIEKGLNDPGAVSDLKQGILESIAASYSSALGIDYDQTIQSSSIKLSDTSHDISEPSMLLKGVVSLKDTKDLVFIIKTFYGKDSQVIISLFAPVINNENLTEIERLKSYLLRENDYAKSYQEVLDSFKFYPQYSFFAKNKLEEELLTGLVSGTLIALFLFVFSKFILKLSKRKNFKNKK